MITMSNLQGTGHIISPSEFKGQIGKMCKLFEDVSYPMYESNDSSFDLFNQFFKGHIENEVNNGCLITKELIRGDFPLLRAILLEKVGKMGVEKYNNSYNDFAGLFEFKLNVFKDAKLEDEFIGVLLDDVNKLYALGINELYDASDFDIYREISSFDKVVGQTLKTVNDPRLIEAHKDLIKLLPEQAQVDIMQNYVSQTEKFKSLCNSKKPTPEHFVREFIDDLFDKDMEKYETNISPKAIGALMGHLKRTDIIQGNENYGMYRSVRDTLNHFYLHNEGDMEDYVKMVPPPNVMTLDKFGINIDSTTPEHSEQ